MPEHGFDPDQILRVLSEQGVEFVLIGGYAAALHGSNHLTFDIDITPSRAPSNLDRLSSALHELGARVRVEGIDGGLAFEHDGPSLARVDVWNLVTDAGDLDLSFEPSGTEGWPDCRRRAPPRRSGVQTDTEGARATASAVSHSRPTWSEPSSSSSSFSSNDVST